jgi:transposase
MPPASGHPPSPRIEACAPSPHWSRELQALGHTVRLMPPAYVKPYVKPQDDMADAKAICEAVTRANMRFVTNQDTRSAELPDALPHPLAVHPAADRDCRG